MLSWNGDIVIAHYGLSIVGLFFFNFFRYDSIQDHTRLTRIESFSSFPFVREYFLDPLDLSPPLPAAMDGCGEREWEINSSRRTFAFRYRFEPADKCKKKKKLRLLLILQSQPWWFSDDGTVQCNEEAKAVSVSTFTCRPSSSSKGKGAGRGLPTTTSMVGCITVRSF